MSATVMSEAPTAIPQTILMTCQTEVKSVVCDCCGLIEECTLGYIERIRERFSGKWICGLCSEAVTYEIARSNERMISTEEALTRHISFCKKFNSPPPVNSAVHLISAMRRILRRSLEASSVPCSPVKSDRTALIRSESCIATLASSSFGDVEQHVV